MLIWKHQKTNDEYSILGFGIREHDMMPVVYYQNGDGPIWSRPCAEFFDGRFMPKSKAGRKPKIVGTKASPLTVKPKRGRPPKAETADGEKPKRGRPPKVETADGEKPKRGRPPKAKAETKSKTETKAKAKPKAQSKPKAKAETNVDATPKTKIATDAESLA